MTVYKYKTFEEAEQALWNFHPDERHFERVKKLWNFANQICPIRYPRGIFKFKTIEEANKHRDDIELAHAKRALQSRKESDKKIDRDTYDDNIPSYDNM